MPRDCPSCEPTNANPSEALILPSDWAPFEDSIGSALATPARAWGISNPEVMPGGYSAAAVTSASIEPSWAPVGLDELASTVVPEPTAGVLLALGLAGLSRAGRRRGPRAEPTETLPPRSMLRGMTRGLATTCSLFMLMASTAIAGPTPTRLPTVELAPGEGLRISVSATQGRGCIGGLEVSVGSDTELSLASGLAVDLTGNEIDSLVVDDRRELPVGRASVLVPQFVEAEGSKGCRFQLDLLDDRGVTQASMTLGSGADRWAAAFSDGATRALRQEFARDLREIQIATENAQASIQAAGGATAAAIPYVGPIIAAIENAVAAVLELVSEIEAKNLEQQAAEKEQEAGIGCSDCQRR